MTTTSTVYPVTISNTDYANAAALTALDTSLLKSGSTASITGLGCFILDKNSTATPDSTTIIAATPNGNWLLQTNPYLMLNSSNVIDVSQIPQVQPTVPVQAPVGTVSLPGYTFAGDTDTGFYHPSANQVAIALNGANAITWTSSAMTLASGLGFTMTAARVQEAQGASVASATNVTLGSDGNFFLITGTTTIQTIAATGWQAGSVIRLMFNASVTVTNAGSGTGATLLLAGAANMSATANDTLSLIYNGTNWVELCRSVN